MSDSKAAAAYQPLPAPEPAHDGECSSLYGRALGRDDACDCAPMTRPDLDAQHLRECSSHWRKGTCSRLTLRPDAPHADGCVETNGPECGCWKSAAPTAEQGAN